MEYLSSIIPWSSSRRKERSYKHLNIYYAPDSKFMQIEEPARGEFMPDVPMKDRHYYFHNYIDTNADEIIQKIKELISAGYDIDNIHFMTSYIYQPLYNSVVFKGDDCEFISLFRLDMAYINMVGYCKFDMYYEPDFFKNDKFNTLFDFILSKKRDFPTQSSFWELPYNKQEKYVKSLGDNCELFKFYLSNQKIKETIEMRNKMSELEQKMNEYSPDKICDFITCRLAQTQDMAECYILYVYFRLKTNNIKLFSFEKTILKNLFDKHHPNEILDDKFIAGYIKSKTCENCDNFLICGKTDIKCLSCQHNYKVQRELKNSEFIDTL